MWSSLLFRFVLPCFYSGLDWELGCKTCNASFCCSHQKEKKRKNKCHVCNKEPYLQASPWLLYLDWSFASASLSVTSFLWICRGLLTFKGRCAAFAGNKMLKFNTGKITCLVRSSPLLDFSVLLVKMLTFCEGHSSPEIVFSGHIHFWLKSFLTEEEPAHKSSAFHSNLVQSIFLHLQRPCMTDDVKECGIRLNARTYTANWTLTLFEMDLF